MSFLKSFGSATDPGFARVVNRGNLPAFNWNPSIIRTGTTPHRLFDTGIISGVALHSPAGGVAPPAGGVALAGTIGPPQGPRDSQGVPYSLYAPAFRPRNGSAYVGHAIHQHNVLSGGRVLPGSLTKSGVLPRRVTTR